MCQIIRYVSYKMLMNLIFLSDNNNDNNKSSWHLLMNCYEPVIELKAHFVDYVLYPRKNMMRQTHTYIYIYLMRPLRQSKIN